MSGTHETVCEKDDHPERTVIFAIHKGIALSEFLKQSKLVIKFASSCNDIYLSLYEDFII